MCYLRASSIVSTGSPLLFQYLPEYSLPFLQLIPHLFWPLVQGSFKLGFWMLKKPVDDPVRKLS